jgi:hypothetical protein
MPKRMTALLFLAVFATQAYPAERLHTRYGQLVALPIPGKTSRFSIQLRGKEIVDVKADDVKLYRVTPRGKVEYVVIEAWNPGLYCHYHYLIVEIASGKATQHSRPFGDCYQLRSASYVPNAVQVELTSTGPLPGKATFFWTNGKLSQGTGQRNAP